MLLLLLWGPHFKNHWSKQRDLKCWVFFHLYQTKLSLVHSVKRYKIWELFKKIYYSFNADLVELGHADPTLKKPWAQRWVNRVAEELWGQTRREKP